MTKKFLFSGFIFCWFLFIDFSSVLADPWTNYDVAEDILNRWSYDWDKENCQTFDKLIGYRANPRMKPDNPVGYFSPNLFIVHGTYMPFSDKCHQFGQRNTTVGEGFCGYIYPAGSVCTKIETIKEGGHWDAIYAGYQRKVLEQYHDVERVQAFKDGTGEFGPDPLIPGEQKAFCAYYRFFGCGGASSPCGGKNNYMIKCVRIPAPPTPPNLCDVIPVGSSFKLVYVRPTQGGINNFFKPAVKIVYSEARKRCNDGTIIGISDNCPDGSDGQFIGEISEHLIESEASMGQEDFPEIFNKTVSMLGASYEFTLYVDMEEVCVHYKNAEDKSIESKFLGCMPRTPLQEPELNVIGSIGESPEEDNLSLEVFFSEAKPSESEIIADIVKLEDLYGNNPNTSPYFGLSLSSMQTAWKIKDNDEEVLDAKLVCKKENPDGTGEVIIADPTSKCDDVLEIQIINGFQCNDGTYVREQSQCEDGTDSPTSVVLKECNENTFIEANNSCYIGNIDYQTDPEGESICLRGMEHEIGKFFVERSVGERIYFQETPLLLHPVKVENGNIVDDVSSGRIKYNLREIDQSILDKAFTDYRGIFSFAQDSSLLTGKSVPRGQYVNKRTEFYNDATGAKTTYVMSDNTLTPFFPTERDIIIPISPLTRKLCAEIDDLIDRPPPNLSVVEYDQASLYFSDDPRGKIAPDTSYDANRPVSYFDDVVRMKDVERVVGRYAKRIPDNPLIFGTPQTPGGSYFINLSDEVPQSIRALINNYPQGKNTFRDLSLSVPASDSELCTHHFDHYYLPRVVESMFSTGRGTPEPYEGGQTSPPMIASYGLIGFIDDRLSLKGCSQIEFELWGTGANGLGDTNAKTNNSNNRTFLAHEDRTHMCKEGSCGESGGYFKGRIRLKRSSDNIIALALGNSLETACEIPYTTSTKINRREQSIDSSPTALWLSENGERFKLMAVADSGTTRAGVLAREGVWDCIVLNDTFPKGTTDPDGKYSVLDLNSYGTRQVGWIGVDGTYSVGDALRPSLYLRKAAYMSKVGRETVAWDKKRVIALERRYVSGTTFCGRNNEDASLSTNSAMTPPIEILDDSDLNNSSILIPSTGLIDNNQTGSKSEYINYVGTWALSQIIAYNVEKAWKAQGAEKGKTHRDQTPGTGAGKHICSFASKLLRDWDAVSKEGDVRWKNQLALMQMGKMTCNFTSSGTWGSTSFDDFKFVHDNLGEKTKLFSAPMGKDVHGLGGGHITTYHSNAFKSTWLASRGSGAYVKVSCIK